MAKQLKIFDIDPYLSPFASDIELRMGRYHEKKKDLLPSGTLADFASGHLYFGIHRDKGGWVYREWAPAAEAVYLYGDFNDWQPEAHPLTRLESGVWELFLPGKHALSHKSLVKTRITHNGHTSDRIPLYIRRTVQDKDNHTFCGQIWEPANPFVWTDEKFKVKKPLYIYEAHIGMAQEEGRIGTYSEFTEKILPRIKAEGYTAVQLMAIMDHPYYASFGYQVGSFFAASSWFGTPEELKELINTAHSMGIAVFLDLVHSHASKNTAEGIACFDGTESQFFHEGPRGHHPAWDSRLFDYSKEGVLKFLLSNVKFWLEEYHFDGFRFDGVTSMIYLDHGLGTCFDNYNKYYSMNTDIDALVYLMLANDLIDEVKKDTVTIAEDVSGMPGIALPLKQGGVGFDYRLSMGVPDFWVKTLRDTRDEDLDMSRMWYELTTRRPGEKNIGYCESHDQAMVGDKTIIFWLCDKEMYYGMDKASSNFIIERGVALHKMIRFITLTLAGEGYLNFMGNEFGHPEWIDFPREGNNWSFHYARRQWSLADNPELKYEWLLNFDRDMLTFSKKYKLPGSTDTLNLWMDYCQKLLACKKAGLIFLFNFNPTCSFSNFFLPVHESGKYRVVFSSDEPIYGGQGRIDTNYAYEARVHPGRGVGFEIYTPCRTVLVMEKIAEGK